jgi:hypothetical protein
MKLFSINSGTPIKVVEDLEGLDSPSYRDYETTKDLLFEPREMVADPTGIAHSFSKACTPEVETLGGEWAERGWFAFERKGYVVLVPGDKVEVLQ